MRKSGSYTANLLGTIRSHLAGLQGYDVMALELIQNADDAPAEEITFDVTDDGLWVRNSGTFGYCGDLHANMCPFQESEGYSCDYHRIVDVASGGKLGQSENIGRFGIGFVSSYQITDHPRIRSSGISLTLRPEAGEWDLEPCEETPETEFFLPWARDANTKARQALGVSHVTATHIDRVTEDLTNVVRRSLLFLRYVTRAEVRRNGQLLAGCDLDRGDGTDLLVSFRPGDDVEQWHILRADASAHAAALRAAHPRLEGLQRSTSISIGVRVDPEPLQEGLLYAFLPTEHSTGLPLHINADSGTRSASWTPRAGGSGASCRSSTRRGCRRMTGPSNGWCVRPCSTASRGWAMFFPESDRKAIVFKGHQHEHAWNEMLIDAAAIELARDPVALRTTLGDVQFWRLLSNAYELQSRPSGHPGIFKQFWDRLKSACADAPIVLAQEDDTLRRPNETILPHGPLFTRRQVAVLHELGGHVAIDSLQTHRNAMIQLGAQILTFDRLLNLIQGGLSALKAGESQVTPERVGTFYRPLWMMLDDLLPERGSRSLASAVHRLKALPAIVSEDLYCVTISHSYAAPSSLDSTRVAELLPRLSIASRGLGATPKILSLVATLDLAGVVTHLAKLAQDNSLAGGGISREPRDLKDLYNLFADLDVGKQTNESVYKELRALPVWPSSKGLISAQAALLPGNFRAPSGVGDLLDTTVLSERAREFVRTKLGVATQSIEAFAKTVVPTFFGDDGPADVEKYTALILELANQPSLLNDEHALQILGSLPMIPTQDGGWSCPVETYRRSDSLVRVLGDADHLWLDVSRVPRARSVQNFFNDLGLRRTPMAQHLVDRMISLGDELPTDDAKRASAEAFYALCDNFDIWKDALSFLDALGDLREAACFPAEGDVDEWHVADTLYAIYSAEAFRSQAKILDFRNTTRLKTPLLEALGIKINPETALVVRHLQHCMKNNVKPSDVVYRVLNDRAPQDEAAIEVLANSRCIYDVESLKSFVHPEQLFWSHPHLGRFAFTIPSNYNSYRPLFDVLGVKDGPEAADYVRIIHEISDEYFVQSKALQGQDRAVFDLCWKSLATLYDRDALDAGDVRKLQEAATVVNVNDHLVDPDEVLIQDSEWYAGFFNGDLDAALCKPLPELWPLLEEVGVRRLSQQARVALEFTDGEEMEQPCLASTLVARSDLIQRLLHDRPQVLRVAVASGFSNLTAKSYEVVHIQASVQIGDDDDPPQPASPIRAHAYYDRETHVLSVERPVGDRSWSHVLNALLHQLIPDAAGSEVPKLTLSLRPLMALSPEEGHRELSDAGVPELEDIAISQGAEDTTSPELGPIGTDDETQDATDDDDETTEAMQDEGEALRAGPGGGVPQSPSPPPKDEPQGPHTEGEEVQQPAAQPVAQTPDQPRGSPAPTNPPPPAPTLVTGGPVVPGTGAKKSRPKHKVQRDKRLLSYVNHAGGEDAGGENGGNSEHNMAIEAAARDAVHKYEIARGRTPKQMALTHPGYDIVSQDLARGTQRLIEVKGIAGEWNKTGVGLSKLQFTNAQEYPEQYWLYVVEFVSDPPNMRIHPIAKPATQVTSFMFDGNWRAVVDEEPIDPIIAFRPGVRVKHRNWGFGRIATVDVRGSMRLLAVDFENKGRQTVPLSVHAMSVVGEEDDGDAPT